MAPLMSLTVAVKLTHNWENQKTCEEITMYVQGKFWPPLIEVSDSNPLYTITCKFMRLSETHLRLIGLLSLKQKKGMLWIRNTILWVAASLDHCLINSSLFIYWKRSLALQIPIAKLCKQASQNVCTFQHSNIFWVVGQAARENSYGCVWEVKEDV